jgi:hypothetical protein
MLENGGRQAIGFGPLSLYASTIAITGLGYTVRAGHVQARWSPFKESCFTDSRFSYLNDFANRPFLLISSELLCGWHVLAGRRVIAETPRENRGAYRNPKKPLIVLRLNFPFGLGGLFHSISCLYSFPELGAESSISLTAENYSYLVTVARTSANISLIRPTGLSKFGRSEVSCVWSGC